MRTATTVKNSIAASITALGMAGCAAPDHQSNHTPVPAERAAICAIRAISATQADGVAHHVMLDPLLIISAIETVTTLVDGHGDPAKNTFTMEWQGPSVILDKNMVTLSYSDRLRTNQNDSPENVTNNIARYTIDIDRATNSIVQRGLEKELTSGTDAQKRLVANSAEKMLTVWQTCVIDTTKPTAAQALPAVPPAASAPKWHIPMMPPPASSAPQMTPGANAPIKPQAPKSHPTSPDRAWQFEA